MVRTSGVDADLSAECEVFVEYLLGSPAPRDVAIAYTQAHAIGALGTPASSALDHAALWMARRGPRLARAADAFAAWAARGGLLRRKIVLLVAILESRGDSADRIDTARPGAIAWFFVDAAARVALTLLLAIGAAVIIVPLAGWYAVSGTHRASAGAEAR